MTSGADILTRVVPLLLGGAALAVVGGVILMVFKKSLLGAGGGDTQGPPLTLADLRRMHQQGVMSDDEFERAKAVMIAEYRGGKPPGGPTPRANPEPGDRIAEVGFDLTGEPLPNIERDEG